ncbi:sirohydrochlorin ferrochelatase [Prauserella shujinwangii]|uniref:Sirohydrochlorin ferrochelatase n=1 Tax=Prauserella shujinwangii TaxID=1453103 RepID=A0A2T0LU49_9PSEU|nr:sirohydrochlorin chelatase [Prauserella shujinwangii]PRX47233.1 sirohydrochlorin ferrochelatase [Prauserella shujinwangii]
MTLVAVAHGSRDPRSAATVRALVGAVRTVSPGLDVREAFLDLSEPKVGDVLARLHAEGARTAVAAPLLLGSAYHARVDLPGIVAEAAERFPPLRVSVADVLGTDPLLDAVALDRLAAAGADPADPELGVVVAAVGSSHPPANDAVARLAARWQARHGCLAAPAFASAAKPDVPAALARLRARGARHFAVASWFLAPGLLPDRVLGQVREHAPGAPVAEPLGADPRVAELVVRRYHEAVSAAARSA